jgi:hypothetical protein
VHETTWNELCSGIHELFSHDQHESLIRQLFHIKQSGSMQEYIDKFSELVDQLMAYEHSSDHHYYTTRLIDGLRDDTKSVILVQRPADLDIVCSLALLQEEVESSRRREYKRMDYSFKPKNVNTTFAHPLPLSPIKIEIVALTGNTIDSKNDSRVYSKVSALKGSS